MEKANKNVPQENETFSGFVTSWGECVVTTRAQLDEQQSTGPVTSTESNQET
jgi:hypothetical protein